MKENLDRIDKLLGLSLRKRQAETYDLFRAEINRLFHEKQAAVTAALQTVGCPVDPDKLAVTLFRETLEKFNVSPEERVKTALSELIDSWEVLLPAEFVDQARKVLA